MLNEMFSSVNMLQKGLNASWLRNEVISNNIANVDTPGFKASTVHFEEIMAETTGAGDGLQMVKTNERHIAPSGIDHINDVTAEVVLNDETTTRLDGNNVDIEGEMVALAKNSIEYYATVSKINSEFRKLSSAINVD